MARFRCSACGEFFPTKNVQCPTIGCEGGLATYELAPEARVSSRVSAQRASGNAVKPLRLSGVDPRDQARLISGISEFDRVTGGGLVVGSLVLVAGEPGSGKCVTADTRVLNPLTGGYASITERATELGVVTALNAEGSLVLRSVAAFHSQGEKPVIEIKTRLGRTLRCTPTHPLLTPDGWLSADALVLGTRIAAPRSLPYFGHRIMADHEVKLVAYALSDGHIGQSSFQITTGEPEIEADLDEVARGFGCTLRRRSIGRRGDLAALRMVVPPDQRRLARDAAIKALRTAHEKLTFGWNEWARRSGLPYWAFNSWLAGRSSPSGEQLKAIASSSGLSVEELGSVHWSEARLETGVMKCLREMGLAGSRADTKRVPRQIFELPKDQLATFLRALFSCDGSLFVSSRHALPGLSYTTISRVLAEDVQHLLLRFGVVAKLRVCAPYPSKKGLRFPYDVAVRGHTGVDRFLNQIGIMGRQAARAKINHGSSSRDRTLDTIPVNAAFWNNLKAAAGGIGFEKICERAGVSPHYHRARRLTRQTVAALLAAYPDARPKMVFDEVFWDEVMSVTAAGVEATYDLSVEPEANFIANDLVIHNSTLMAMVADVLVHQRQRVIYISGEESPGQIRLRAERLGLDLDLEILCTGDASEAAATIERERPAVAIIDSIQTLSMPDSEGVSGAPAQVRTTTERLMRAAKTSGTALLLIGHVNKDSAIAGPKTLEHLVDAVLMLEGDRLGGFRVLRALKNRFGPTDEIGLFEMGEKGMIGIDTPTPLHEASGVRFGRAICPVLEGSRPILVEIQALVAKASYGTGGRTAVGLPLPRLRALLAVMERYAEIDLSAHDVYVSTGAGIAVAETAVDAAVLAAIASSYWGTPLPETTAVFGEVALGGGLRPVRSVGSRAKEAARQGFLTLVGPTTKGLDLPKGLILSNVSDVRALLTTLGVLRPAGATPVPAGRGPSSPPGFFWGQRKRAGERGEADERSGETGEPDESEG
jgi:DNA repair protein RadA/Sms